MKEKNRASRNGKTDKQRDFSLPSEEVIIAYCERNQLNTAQVLEGFVHGIAAITESMIQGNSIKVANFGSFRWKHWKSRFGYNRYSKEAIEIPASWHLKFLPEDNLSPFSEDKENE